MSIKKQIQRFWKIFEEESNNLQQALVQNDHDEVKEITKILNTYFEEFSNCSLEVTHDDGIFEVTLLPEQEKNIQFITALMKKMAPSNVTKDWLVHAQLPALTQKAIHTTLRIENQDYTADDFLVHYSIDTNNRCINVEMYCSAFTHTTPDKALELSIYMLQLFIGETALEAYINHIDVITEKKAGNVSLLSHFYEMLLDIVEEQKWTNFYEASDIYRLFKIEDESALVDELRQDLKTIVSLHPLLIAETMQQESLIANQFYDLGGEYGYVFYENTGNAKNDALVRQALEKQLHELFYVRHCARSIGGGIGTRYSYIDLAIFDKDEFLKILPIINKKLSIPLAYRSFQSF